MSSGVETPERLPALRLLASVVFPDDVVSVQLPDEECAAPLDFIDDAHALVATIFDAPRAERSIDGQHEICVLARVVQRMQMPGGGCQVVFQGVARARVVDLEDDGNIRWAHIVQVEPDSEEIDEDQSRAVLRVLDLLTDYLQKDGTYPEDLENILRMNLESTGRFADMVAAYLHLPLPVKREVATTVDSAERLDMLRRSIEAELARFTIETDIHKRVRDQIEDRQREQYLRQQMKAIRRELGDEGSPDEDGDKLAEQMRTAGLSAEAREIVERELRRLRSISPSSAEYHVIRNYVSWVMELPWKKRTRDRLDISRARKILHEQHSGLDKVKERIVEHLAVKKLNRKARGSILCLVGPPGVGKTTLGRSVAKSLGRKFVRMSVGGLRDEAEIKGHRRTYVGAMPGKVIQLLKRAGVRNPVLQIDEIDKMGSDHRGDPASAVLEVLDPECNAAFRDHYLDVGFDLSDVFFLVTANVLDSIPSALRDRLEIVRIGGYTQREKLAIARTHLVPRAIKENGLREDAVRFTSGGLERIIEGHTREAGLRELERTLKKICRKVATRWVEGNEELVRVGKQRVSDFLGAPRYKPDLAGRCAEVGVATGLAWTAYGGTLLSIEANRMVGKGDIVVTGQLGDVMKESARAAMSFVRAHASEFDIDSAEFARYDIHIHFPEGATPKDGPSAGVAIATCLASLFTGRAVRHDLAMTGEITLKGKVLEVGGIKEKLLAAHRAGIRTVLIPQDNVKDLEEVPEEVRKELIVVATDDVEQNICEALLNIVVPKHGTSLAEVSEQAPLQVAKEKNAKQRN